MASEHEFLVGVTGRTTFCAAFPEIDRAASA